MHMPVRDTTCITHVHVLAQTVTVRDGLVGGGGGMHTHARRKLVTQPIAHTHVHVRVYNHVHV